jgi:hypothetical protein
MQENTMSHVVLPKATKTPYYLSIFLLILVIVATILLSFLSILKVREIDTWNEQIATKNTEIAEVKKDNNVIITKILASGTVPPTLDLIGLVRSFREAAAQANVRLKGFAIAKDEITTNLIATEGNPNIHPDAASTIVTMIQAYAKKEGVPGFALDPITSISGDPKLRTTAIKFKVTPVSSNNP